VRIRPVSGVRPYPIPGPAAVAAVLLVALGVALALLANRFESPAICPFRATTGLPCPTCGLVRAAGAILRGNIGAALLLNPFDAIFLLVAVPAAALVLAANRLFGIAIRTDITAVEKRLFLSVAVTLLAANWVYVLLTQP